MRMIRGSGEVRGGGDGMAEYRLTSPNYELEEEEAVEFYYDRGWSDGLPVVPPLRRKSGQCWPRAGLEPDAQIAFIETRQASDHRREGGDQRGPGGLPARIHAGHRGRP